VDIWKENVLKDMKAGKLVLEKLKREFGGEYDELAKVEELKSKTRIKNEKGTCEII